MMFKAKNFLGVFSIRNGCLVACIIQIVLGLGVWKSLDYLRPMLKWFNMSIMIWFVVGAILGLYGIIMRNEVVTWLYLIHLGSCATIIFLVCLDFAGFIHFFPKPPVAPSVPIKPPVVEKMEMAAEKVAEAAAHPIAAISGGENATKTPAAAFLTAGTFSFKPSRPFHSPKTFRATSRNPMLLSLKENVQKSPTVTEGSTEEVSRDEMPPEAAALPVNLQKQVTSTTKAIKHVVKFVMAGGLTMAFVFQIYCTWIVFTFVLNKCTSVDELTDQPEQFEPVLQGGSISTVFTEGGSFAPKQSKGSSAAQQESKPLLTTPGQP